MKLSRRRLKKGRSNKNSTSYGRLMILMAPASLASLNWELSLTASREVPRKLRTL